MKIISIDPGKIASWAKFDTDTPQLMQVGDIETTGVGRLTRPCAVHIRALVSDVDLVLTEDVGTRPREGVVSAFTFGMAFGSILSAVQGAEKPLRTVTPKQWSAVLKLKASATTDEKKAAAIALARELWPCTRQTLVNKSHHNRADAALMIWWFMKHGDGRLVPSLAVGDESA